MTGYGLDEMAISEVVNEVKNAAGVTCYDFLLGAADV